MRRYGLSTALILLLLILPVVAAHAIDAAEWDDFELAPDDSARFEGPFECGAAAIYFVHHGGPLKITLSLSSKDDAGKMRKALVRFLDADEQYRDWDYQWFPAEGTIDTSWDFALDEAEPGIYQVRLALHGSFTWDVTTAPATSFGIMPMRTRLYATAPEQFSDAWVYVPPQSELFVAKTYARAALNITCEGDELLAMDHSTHRGRIDVTDSPALWHVDLTLQPNAFINSRGVPLLLCPDRTTAENIRGSVEFLPDGSRVWHKFQKRIYRVMHSFEPEDLELDVARSFEPHLDALLQEPVRNAGLFDSYGALRHVRYSLEEQNLNPASIWYGSVHAWKSFEEKGLRWDRWATFPSHTLSYTGLPNNIAAGYAIDGDINPYGGDEAVLNRAILAALADLLAIHEDDSVKHGKDHDMDSYAGVPAFPINHNLCMPYGMCAADAPDEVRQVWTEGYRHIIDRFCFYRVSCENQSAHYPVSYYALQMGGEVSGYDRLAHDYVRSMCDPELNRFMKTGYTQEAYGPDPTYQGLACSNIAQYWVWSDDEAALNGLQRIYNFFNHTVAPEPDGYIWGACNFAHRTPYGWQHPQYGAGLTMMAGELPEAGLWRHNADPNDLENIERATESIKNAVGSPYTREPYEDGSLMGAAHGAVYTGSYHRWLEYPDSIDKSGRLPCLQSDRFSKNFNDEFFAIRRPGYYALIYTGHTAAEWTKSRISFKPEQKFQRSGGGLSLLWTPEYGNLLVSMTYHAFCNHQVTAEFADGTVSWPDYWSVDHTWAPEADTLSVTSRLYNLPVSLVREYAFGDASIHQSLTVRFEEDVSVQALYEQIPLLKNKPGFRTEMEGTEDACRALWVGDEQGRGCILEFDEPVAISFGPDLEHKRYSEVQINTPLQIDLGSNHSAGDEITVGYTTRSCPHTEFANGG